MVFFKLLRSFFWCTSLFSKLRQVAELINTIMLARCFLSSGITVGTLETKDILTNVAVIFLLCCSTKVNAVTRCKNNANWPLIVLITLPAQPN